MFEAWTFKYGLVNVRASQIVNKSEGEILEHF